MFGDAGQARTKAEQRPTAHWASVRPNNGKPNVEPTPSVKVIHFELKLRDCVFI